MHLRLRIRLGFCYGACQIVGYLSLEENGSNLRVAVAGFGAIQRIGQENNADGRVEFESLFDHRFRCN